MPPVQLSAVTRRRSRSDAFWSSRRVASSVSLGRTGERVSVSFMAARNRSLAPNVPEAKRGRINMAEAKQDAIKLLTQDHREVEALFEKFEKATRDGTKEKLARQICTELKIHTMIEEEIFYPALRGKIDDDDLDEAMVEHDGAKILVNEIEAGGPDEEFYEAKVKVLQEQIKHHVKEEEKQQGNIFQQARATDVDLEALGQQMAARKQELMRLAETEALPPAQPATMATEG